jgi:hypothetical protein
VDTVFEIVVGRAVAKWIVGADELRPKDHQSSSRISTSSSHQYRFMREFFRI